MLKKARKEAKSSGERMAEVLKEQAMRELRFTLGHALALSAAFRVKIEVKREISGDSPSVLFRAKQFPDDRESAKWKQMFRAEQRRL